MTEIEVASSYLSAHESRKIRNSMSLVIQRSRRPLADVRGLMSELNSSGFSPDQIHQNLASAISLARLARMAV
jgi:hypothetical protein